MNRIFMVAALLNPKQKDIEENDAAPEIAMQPTAVVAKNEDQARTKALLGCKELADVDADRVEVFVRPF